MCTTLDYRQTTGELQIVLYKLQLYYITLCSLFYPLLYGTHVVIYKPAFTLHEDKALSLGICEASDFIGVS